MAIATTMNQAVILRPAACRLPPPAWLRRPASARLAVSPEIDFGGGGMVM
jgi:hypothetical protein